jgi:putative oxidoreductase
MNYSNFPAYGPLVLRLGLGFLMLHHGYPKLLKLFAGGEIHFADPLGFGPTFTLILAVFAEFFCSILLIIGYKTKWATIPLFLTMLVAFVLVKAGHSWENKELAVLYAVGYLALFFLGSGKFSVDRFLSKRKS